MQPPTALPAPPSLAAFIFAEYVGGLFENAPDLVKHRCPLFDGHTMLAALQWSQRNSHLQTRRPWFHIVGLALMVSQCPPDLSRAHTLPHRPRQPPSVSYRHSRPNGLTIASRPLARSNHTTATPKAALGLISSQPPQWSHSNSPLSPFQTYPTAPHDIRKRPFDGYNATRDPLPLPLVSSSSRKARWWPSCVGKMCVAVCYLHLQRLTALFSLSGKETLGPTVRRIAEGKGGSELPGSRLRRPFSRCNDKAFHLKCLIATI